MEATGEEAGSGRLGGRRRRRQVGGRVGGGAESDDGCRCRHNQGLSVVPV